MSDAVEQIKSRLDIADFLRGYLTLTPAGKNLKANCPFHKEKTPSFMVSPDRQRWHCFGCGLDGDLIGFLMRYENLDFVEALKILGEKTGVDIGRVGTADQKQFNILYEINRETKEFFKKQLVANQAAIDYLKSRQMKGETAKEFEVGFAPDNPDALSRYLLGIGHSITNIEKAGLVFKTDRGTYLDRFRARIMFPLFNHFGKTIGFTGRIMPGAESERVGKYVNSPETPIFNKSKILYGFHLAKNHIRDAGAAVLVEGQMDFIMAWQDGIRNLAATSGTALTLEHLKALRRLADKLILSFDQDEAGRLATERAIDLAGAADFSARVLRVPADLQAKDPADVAVARPGLLKDLIEKSQPSMEYYFDRYQITERKGEWKKNLRAVLSKIKFLASPMEQAHWLKEAAKLSGIEERYLAEEMAGIKLAEPPRPEDLPVPGAEEAPLSRRDLISQWISSLVLNHRDFYQELLPLASHLPETYRSALAYHLENRALPEAAKEIADLISLRSGLEADLEPAKAKTELKELFRQLRLENLKDERQRLSEDVQLAERKREDPTSFLVRKQKIAEEIRQLEIEPPKVA